MSTAQTLVQQLGDLTVDPRKVSTEAVTTALVAIITRGRDAWRRVGELDAGVDITHVDISALAGFGLDNNRTQDFDFAQTVRIADDARSIGASTDVDRFLAVAAPVRQALFRRESSLLLNIASVEQADRRRARSEAGAETARVRSAKARTAWGRRRTAERAQRLETRAQGLTRDIDDRVRDIRDKALALAQDADDVLQVLSRWFN
jgi:hypothetical protein